MTCYFGHGDALYGRIVYRLYLIHSRPTQLQVVIKKIITGAGVVY